MPNGRPPEEDPTLLFLLLGGAAIGLGILVITGRRPQGPGGPGGNSPCPPLGDVDGDGWISRNDANLALNHHAGLLTLTPEQFARADVNRDGVVDSIDAALILQVADSIPGAADGFRCELPPQPRFG